MNVFAVGSFFLPQIFNYTVETIVVTVNLTDGSAKNETIPNANASASYASITSSLAFSIGHTADYFFLNSTMATTQRHYTV